MNNLKSVEVVRTVNHKRFIVEILEGPTDNPIRIVRRRKGKSGVNSKTFLIEGLPWKLLGFGTNESVVEYVFNNFRSDI